MEMFVLSRLSRQLLDQATLKTVDNAVWKEAFEACASPSEWKEFLARRGKEDFTTRLKEIYTKIQRTYRAPTRRIRAILLDD